MASLYRASLDELAKYEKNLKKKNVLERYWHIDNKLLSNPRGEIFLYGWKQVTSVTIAWDNPHRLYPLAIWVTKNLKHNLKLNQKLLKPVVFFRWKFIFRPQVKNFSKGTLLFTSEHQTVSALLISPDQTCTKSVNSSNCASSIQSMNVTNYLIKMVFVCWTKNVKPWWIWNVTRHCFLKIANTSCQEKLFLQNKGNWVIHLHHLCHHHRFSVNNTATFCKSCWKGVGFENGLDFEPYYSFFLNVHRVCISCCKCECTGCCLS